MENQYQFLETDNDRLEARVAELLAALEALLPYAEDIEDQGPPGEGWQSQKLCAALDSARAAIAKAKGQA